MAASVSTIDAKGVSGPVVILLGTTFPEADPAEVDTNPYKPPLALQAFHGQALIDHWWDALTSVGLNISTNVYILTNAKYYKSFEFWAFGKGLPLGHIINTGGSLGDIRVGLQAVIQTMQLANRQVARGSSALDTAPHSFLVLAADSVPPHSGAAFQPTLSAILKSTFSALLLEPPHNEAPAAVFPVSNGPVIRVYHAPSDATDLNVVADVKVSIVIDNNVVPAAATEAQASFSPICYFITAEDARELVLPSTYDAIEGESLLLPGVDDSVNRVVPVESAMSWLARNRRVVGLKIADKYQIGAADGSVHRFVPSAASSRRSSISLSALGSRRGSVNGESALFRHAPIVSRAYARVGLLGNPSDGFGGKTLAVTIANFAATVVLTPSNDSSITLSPHQIFDPQHFLNLRQLSTISGREGYSGGLRLLQAALHRFFLHCRSKDIAIPDRGFVAKYHTTIPRQVGLAGSSAILTAFVKGILAFYGFDTEAKAAAIGLDSELLPAFVLAIESEELNITAGLQDRVVQAKEGLVHMDFTPDVIKAKGYGTYTKIPSTNLPPLFLAYAADPSDSGRIHAPIKQRWLAGDAEVIAKMGQIASQADIGLSLCTSKPYDAASSLLEAESIAHSWADAFRNNFDLRRSLFGDAALGRDNIRMIEIAREAGASAKFPGSGGAVVGVVDVQGIDGVSKLSPTSTSATGDWQEVKRARVAAAARVLKTAYLREGYVFTLLTPHERDL